LFPIAPFATPLTCSLMVEATAQGNKNRKALFPTMCETAQENSLPDFSGAVRMRAQGKQGRSYWVWV
jgi:hypothetical protein